GFSGYHGHFGCGSIYPIHPLPCDFGLYDGYWHHHHSAADLPEPGPCVAAYHSRNFPEYFHATGEYQLVCTGTLPSDGGDYIPLSENHESSAKSAGGLSISFAVANTISCHTGRGDRRYTYRIAKAQF